LGLDGVNPIYYDTIKILYTFPQSVGIAGGRPSSSYYFVGSQADNLFYLDPHHARPAVPLRPPTLEPESGRNGSGFSTRSGFSATANRTPEADHARERDRSRDRSTREKGKSKEDKDGTRSSLGSVAYPSTKGSTMKRVVTPTSPSSPTTKGVLISVSV
ncbi:hypothetical protein MPER_06258, partial [Moniliophthora perniciosa FA553]